MTTCLGMENNSRDAHKARGFPASGDPSKRTERSGQTRRRRAGGLWAPFLPGSQNNLLEPRI